MRNKGGRQPCNKGDSECAIRAGRARARDVVACDRRDAKVDQDRLGVKAEVSGRRP